MAIDVEVLDLGINNLASLCRGLTEAGASSLRTVASDHDSQGADLLVLPGVGAYGAAVDELAARGLGHLVKRHVDSGGYLFGVCLGMQLLGQSSEESPDAFGLGLIPGRVMRLTPSAGARVPNIGWSGLTLTREPEMFSTLSKSLDFYFVHSFALVPDDDNDVLTKSLFGESDFVSGVLRENVLGLQFHPEKSSRAGTQLLTNVLAWANG